MAEKNTSVTVFQMADISTKITTEVVRHWDANNKDSGAADGPEFEMQVNDRRNSNGQLHIDVASMGGNVDDVMSATFEISSIPGDQAHTQVMHLHFDSDNLAFSIFKQGNKYILRPENDVQITPCMLDRDRAYMVE